MAASATWASIFPDSGSVERALLRESRGAGFVDAGRFLSFSQLLELCDGPHFAGLARADPWLVRSLVAVSAPPLCRQAFGEQVAAPDFALQADALRAELFSNDVSPSLLADVGQRVGGRTGAKLAALGALFERVDEALTSRSLVDPRGVTRLVLRRLTEVGLPDALRRFEGLEVRQLHDLPPVRLSLIDALARACVSAGRGFRLSVPWAGSPDTDAFVGGVVRFFEKRWEALPGVELAPEIRETERARALQRLFSADGAPAAPLEGVTVLSCAGPRDEARAIAAEVVRRIEAGTPCERIAIAFRDLAEDTELVVEQLDALGLPVRARLGVPLSRTPIGRLALSLTRLADESFPVDDVAAILESRYAPSLSDGLPPCRGVFAEAGVRDDRIGAREGRGAWQVRLGALLERRRREATSAGPVREVERLRQAVERLLELGRSLPTRATALELLQRWWRAVQALGTPAALAEATPWLEGRGGGVFDRAVARDQAALDALGSLVRALERGLRGSGLGEVSMERRGFARWLELAAEQVNLPARGARAGAVWLMDARELPGAEFDCVLLGGLVDGRFPGRPAPAPLLSDDERAELNAAAGTTLFRLAVVDDGVALPMRLAEDRLLFQQALTAAPDVVLTVPRGDARGREVLRSPFVDALARLGTGVGFVHRPHRPVPLLDDARSHEELMVRAALELSSPLETRQSPQDPRVGALERVVGDEPWAVRARHLARIEIERLRFFSQPELTPGRFSGLVAGLPLERLQPALEWSPRRPVSASQLETWSRCHFLGLGRRVLRLEEDDSAGEEMDHRALGQLLHAALRRLIPALQAQSRWPAPKPATEAVTRALELALAEAAEEAATTQPIGHHLVFELSVERARRELLRLVCDDAIAPITGAQPRHFELVFGKPDAPEALREVVIPPGLPDERPIAVAGAIDRLDVSPEQVAVLDYKLSRPGTPKARLDALLVADFQLPLYLYAARQLYPGRAVDAAWVGLRKSESLVLSRVIRGEDYSLDDVLSTDLERRRALALEERPNLANSVHALHTSLRRGDFGARPLDCAHCHLRSVCRISARRLSDGPEVE